MTKEITQGGENPQATADRAAAWVAGATMRQARRDADTAVLADKTGPVTREEINRLYEYFRERQL